MANKENGGNTAASKQWTSVEIETAGKDLSLMQDGQPILTLESKGTWLHAGYHLTSATTGPQILSLPIALAALGWGPGVLFLCLGGIVSFYAYYLMSLVTERVEKEGKRCAQFRDLSSEIVGPKWSFYLVGPLQFVVCFTTVVSCILLGGQSLKAIFSAYSLGKGNLSLYQFTVIFGVIQMVLSQLPSFHSLRHLNLVSVVVSTAYALLTVYGSILAGHSNHAPKKDYAIVGTPMEKMFNAFNALSIISNVYGNVVTVEIQATLATPSLGKMTKGLYICYTIVLVTFFPVAISGYWAFGRRCEGNILMNMFPKSDINYIPEWVYVLANLFIVIQLVTSSLVYSQPTFATLEEKFIDVNKHAFSSRNLLPRLLSRSIFAVVATIFAAMLPFFSSINSLLGALGYTPLVFVIPMVFHIAMFKPSSRRATFWINYTMISLFTIVAILGCIAAFRQLIVDAQRYHLFADL